jgi:hypothetical protein
MQCLCSLLNKKAAPTSPLAPPQAEKKCIVYREETIRPFGVTTTQRPS